MRLRRARLFSRLHTSCLALLILCPTATASIWQVVRVGPLEYVTLKSFCRFYYFPYGEGPLSDTFTVQNTSFRLVFRRDSQIVRINEVNYYLSSSIIDHPAGWLIPKTDITKLFDPIFRPQAIPIRRPVRGVVIDPGHGGSDRGATGLNGALEKHYTLDTSLRLEKILRAAGVRTVMTRRSDVFVELHERTRFARNFAGHIFVSIHYNYGFNRQARGVETFAMAPRGVASTAVGEFPSRADHIKQIGNENDPLNILLAHQVHRQIVRLFPGDPEADRGVKRARFVVLRTNYLPAILVEGGFLTNRMDLRLVDNPVYRQRLAEAIATGILNYIRLNQPTQP
ncbi:MAG: N-acetylmuramoyl-L-alanine amidase [Methylacidiphilales bacterium]|nr:N-acetylmuramoyl-L-alanine amidase [Candidatus Methylacidiphilales bacterium]MDW8349056.1 N-acetylmuramoyl-L-alanine amidase [Verrucomicrobiae bacterium]